MNKAVLLLGSNIGWRAEALEEAKRLIERKAGAIIRKSLVYDTAPWGNEEQASFLNQAIIMMTVLSPHELLHILLQTELEMGRQRIKKWEPRLIDIDILFFNQEIINTDKLTIPHPLIRERRFALVPLNEIVPEFIHPLHKCSISELLKSCNDQQQVKSYI